MRQVLNLTPGLTVPLPEIEGLDGTSGSRFKIKSAHPGGMGICYRIVEETSGAEFALKCVRPDLLGTTDTLDRFHEELDVWLAASSCDGVAEAIAVVRINDIPSVVGRWMNGGDLAQALPIMSPAQKCQTILRIVRSLEWVNAHLAVIHRDLKPANVLLDAEGLAYVSDWGLSRPTRVAFRTAKAADNSLQTDRPNLTQHGSFLGTILYAAPEQILDATSVDHRADIYALGCMIFEMEVGHPPFIGDNIRDIIRQHLYESPPKLGGRFRKRTILGLEGVIHKCLEKEPTRRYSTYKELGNIIGEIANRRGFSTARCKLAERYKRHRLGTGHPHLLDDVQNAPAKSAARAFMEVDDLRPYLDEVSGLLALKRFGEAEKLLGHFYHPEILNAGPNWNIGHSLAEAYAFCIQNLPGRRNEAIAIYSRLGELCDKPSNYYVNHSLTLCRASRQSEAAKVCKTGLLAYQDDVDILGNYTIALAGCDQLTTAQKSAMRRLELRRDVHSLEEAAGVISRQKAIFRDKDLPIAIKLAKQEFCLIQEGLALNPRYSSLLLKQIQLLRFAHADEEAVNACQEFYADTRLEARYRQLAFVEMVKELSIGDGYKVALDLIDRTIPHLTFEEARLASELTKYEVISDRLMLGRNDSSGRKIVIKDVVSFFLKQVDGAYPHPVMAGRILEWVETRDEAEQVLRSQIADSWEARKHLALLLQRAGRAAEGYKLAQSLIDLAPWLSESYDVLAFLAESVGDSDAAEWAKNAGTRTFEKEMILFDELKVVLLK